MRALRRRLRLTRRRRRSEVELGGRAERGGGGDTEGFVEGLELLPPEACELSRYRDALCDDLLGGVS